VSPEEVANAIKPIVNGIIDWQRGRRCRTNLHTVNNKEEQTHNDC